MPQPSALPNPVTALRDIHRVAGHFGELVQGRMGENGPLALISLPCPALWVSVGAGVEPTPGLITEHQAARLCEALDLPAPVTLPPLCATMPLGGGAGSSTAALTAVARHAGYNGPPAQLARACAQVEGASDPLMFPHPERVLFAPRAGEVLADLPPLPTLEIVGGFFGPVQRTDPADLHFPDISDLIAAWPHIRRAADIAKLATRSARRSLALRGPEHDPTATIAQELGALGWMIAHTGNARGLIFAPGQVPDHATAVLESHGFTQCLRFQAGGEGGAS